MNWIVQNLGTAFDFLLVVIGFGLIVFIHELGHFVAARWAGIRVMAFAIGFGPAVFSFRKGMGWRRGSSEREYLALLRTRGDSANLLGAGDAAAASAIGSELSPTEYRLNALPFGGYVKMLGQDDLNPNAVSCAADSYQMCPTWRRMVVISAGVIANVITAAVLFIVVYTVGIKVEPPKIGMVAPGSPAANAVVFDGAGNRVSGGIRPGDLVLRIGDREARSFNDVGFGTAMAGRDERLSLSLERGGSTYTAEVMPEFGRLSGLLEIGIDATRSVTLTNPKKDADREALREALAKSGLAGVEPGMRLAAIDGKHGITGLHELNEAVARSDGRPIGLTFQADDGRSASVTIVPKAQMELGLITRSDGAVVPVEHLLGLMPVMAVKDATPPGGGPKASDQGFRSGDVFARLGDVEFPSVAQGVREIKNNKSRSIPVVVLRRGENGAWKEIALPSVKISSEGAIGFLIGDTAEESTLVAAPPAKITPAQAGRPDYEPAASRAFTAAGLEIVSVSGKPVRNFTEIREALNVGVREYMQRQVAGAEPTGPAIEVQVRRPIKGVPVPDGPVDSITWTLTSSDLADLSVLGWTSPVEEFFFEPEQIVDRAKNPLDAVTRGASDTHRVMMTTYLTFKRLIVDRTVKVEHLKGPVGIAHLGTLVAGRGFIWLLFFLALISVNLAVINFLPLPIVDGGQFLFLLYEQVRGRPAPIVVQNALTLAGLALIGCMFLVVTFNDVKNLFGL